MGDINLENLINNMYSSYGPITGKLCENTNSYIKKNITENLFNMSNNSENNILTSENNIITSKYTNK